ncbi:MAG: class I SAM-dependent methyltransferase [Acidimicrobiales bacterium]
MRTRWPSVRDRLRTLADRSPVPVAPAAPPADPPEPAPWPEESFTTAVGHVMTFLNDEGIDLAGQSVADIGCGDGVMDLGLALRAAPKRLVGFDIAPVDTAGLLARARARGVATELPPNLVFETCGEDRLPADDASFDGLVSWSAFEHVVRPVAVLREMRRILRPDGVLFVQVWPFFHSKHGSHLWDWFPEGFAQLLHEPGTVEREVRAHPDKGPAWVDNLLAAFHELNRVTVDDLQRALLLAGFRVTKLELETETVHIPPELAHLPLRTLAVSGVKLLARPW